MRTPSRAAKSAMVTNGTGAAIRKHVGSGATVTGLHSALSRHGG